MKITVILTSYNHEKYIKQSIESILNQTYREFEFIIVDDCSTDKSWDIICAYKKEYPEIITIRHEYNWGGGAVEDIVRNYATGDYIALHHSDDIWMVDKLQKQIEAIQSIPDCAAVFTNASAIDDEGKDYSEEGGFYYKLFSVKNRNRYEWLNYFFYHGNCLCHPSILIKKSVYLEDGFFRKGLRQIPDFVKWIQICKKHEIYVLPNKLVKFRVHKAGQNTSGMRADTQMRSATEMFLMLKEYVAIKDKEEFLKVFPDAKKYCGRDFYLTEYVFGRICTEEGMPSYARLFGVQLLYDVFNNPEYAERIKMEYNYTEKEFKQENGNYDIFGIVPKAFEQTRSIYYDTGDGYCAGKNISQKFTLKKYDIFHVCFTLDLAEGERLKRLRFDPAEGVLIKADIFHILINGAWAKFACDNALLRAEDKDIFLTLDPIYNIVVPDEVREQRHFEIDVAGKIERLSDEEIMKAADAMIVEKNSMWSVLENKKYELNAAKTELNVVTTELNVAKTELNRIRSTVPYKLAVKINSFLKIWR